MMTKRIKTLELHCPMIQVLVIGGNNSIKQCLRTEHPLRLVFSIPKVLAQGSSPLAYLTDHVTRYVACVKNKEKEGCDVILNPPKKTEAKKRAMKNRWPMMPKPRIHYK